MWLKTRKLSISFDPHVRKKILRCHAYPRVLLLLVQWIYKEGVLGNMKFICYYIFCILGYSRNGAKYLCVCDFYTLCLFQVGRCSFLFPFFFPLLFSCAGGEEVRVLVYKGVSGSFLRTNFWCFFDLVETCHSADPSRSIKQDLHGCGDWRARRHLHVHMHTHAYLNDYGWKCYSCLHVVKSRQIT